MRILCNIILVMYAGTVFLRSVPVLCWLPYTGKCYKSNVMHAGAIEPPRDPYTRQAQLRVRGYHEATANSVYRRVAYAMVGG